MAAINGSIKISNNWTQTNSTGLPGSLVANLPTNWQFQVTTSGGSADQADLKYTATLSLTSGTPTLLDLTNLTDVFGGVVNFKRVRSVAVRVTPTGNGLTDGTTVALGNAASNAWTGFLPATGTLTLQASDANNHAFFTITAPNTTGMVTSATSKVLQIACSANCSADVEIVGCAE